MTAAAAGLLALALAAGLAPAAADPGAALAEGNRRFRRGDLEGAMAAYIAGYDSSYPDPLLAYNLGATAQRLGRLPEAVLWYRRALAHAPLPLPGPARRDPWLADNLALARGELAAPRVPARGWARWAARRDALLAAACLAAWAALAAELAAGWLGGRRARRAALGLAGAGAALFAVAGLLAAFGPRPAVLLAGCGELPAGSEIWVRRTSSSMEGEAGFRIAGKGPAAGAVCPAGSVGLVAP